MKLLAIILILSIVSACSNSDDTNPVNTDKNATGFLRANVNGVSWYSNKITTSKSNNIRIIKATQDFTNDPIYKSSLLEFRVSVNQAGVFGIGENEPGLNYVVKAYYTLVSKSGSNDLTLKAHFDNISTLTISSISDKNLDAGFIFNARTDDSLNTVEFTNGAIQIDF